ncbi:putative acetyltransferase [Thermocatellispora tengchongensis]|uniref:Putative acetyltransferase n=1 Tax=Thermocatellispora tengchongensis TaxID=1073253 RepID=A0A840PAM3_9ACTN|nr:GNAT family N-acetyltransferase [Thermocatellispora tengchongensis]MBB5136312.1 putative acetyltransferase [Thermocatellispora tengchongensis]
MSGFPIRPLSESEWDAYVRVWVEAFNSADTPAIFDRFRAMTEFDRTLAAFDGPEVVGNTAALSFTMTVPGATTPVAGVTGVAVLPSHRRRGILSALMLRQLTDLHEGGEPVAALYASEAAIYGRFGYGRAADSLLFDIPTRGSAFGPGVPEDPSLRLRVARPAEARKEFETVFEAVRAERPGQYARTAARWDQLLADEEHDREGAGPLRCLIAEDGSAARGYALFRVKANWSAHDTPEGELRLNELYATDPAAYALIWRGVLDRDLVRTVKAWSRPVDDPLIHLIAEPRNLRATWLDDLWIRLVDVDRALAARAYSAPVDVVVQVEDARCPWNARRWRLSGDGSGARCEATSDAADLTLPVSALGAAYLGGRPLSAYGGAGLVAEHTPGALRALSTAMSWEPRPWAGSVF